MHHSTSWVIPKPSGRAVGALLHSPDAPKTGRLARALTTALILLLCAGPAASQDSEDEEELRDLLGLLERQTDLATKTGMNADYVPGMATILSGDDLLARGVRTVWEALSLVPGISQGLETTGERQVLSRGVGHGYASGNVKILVDGVSMNATLTATANPVLNLPIEQVERIEVIRGPGSSVYGEYAYAGVVNVITRQRERVIHLQGRQGPDLGGGGVWYWDNPAQALSASVNAVGVQADGGARVEQDALYAIGRPELSNAPGESNETQHYGAFFANLRSGDLVASLSVLDESYGDYFGINHFLPPADQRLASRQRILSAQVGGDWNLTETLCARLRLEGQRYNRERNDLFVFPAGLYSEQPITMDQDYQESSLRAAADLQWQPVAQHALLFGLEAKQVDVDRASWSWMNLELTLPPNWLDTGTGRRILSTIAQDTFRASERLTLTATLRYDDYDDVGGYLSPRAAAVWRIDEQNILKLQYAQAFRPPTFYELSYAGAGSIDVAEIATLELGYILKRPTWTARTILFHSDLKGPILLDELGTGGFTNGPDVELKGVELEYTQRFGRRVKVDANLSYVDATNQATGDAVPGGASLLGNLALMWQPVPNWTTAVQLRYVGERSRESNDVRPSLDPYTLVDLTLNWSSPGTGPELHLGVKNLGNSDVRYADQFQSFNGMELPYPQSYPRPGRQLWFSVGYRF
jgi:iron complex outermembrane receptor protein